MNRSEINLESLPMEIIIHICHYLEPSFILNVLSKVSRKFENIASDQAIWRIRIFRRWPAKYPPVEPDGDFNWSEACETREIFAHQWSKVETSVDKITIKAHLSSVDALLLVHDGKFLFSGSRDRSLALWRVEEAESGIIEKGLIQRDSTVHKGWVWSLNYNEDSSLFLSTGWDYKINMWDFGDSLRHKSSIACKTAILCSDLTKNNIVTVGTFDKRVQSFDLRVNNNNNGSGSANAGTAAIEEFKIHKGPVLGVCVNPVDENQLISASEDTTVAVIDRRTQKVIKRLHFTKGYPMILRSLGATIFIGDKNGNLHLLDASNRIQPLRRIKSVIKLHDGKIHGIDAALEGTITGSSDGTVKLLHPDITCSVVTTLDTKDVGQVTSVSYCNSILATGHSLETIQIWRPRPRDLD